jgi:signal peptidase I
VKAARPPASRPELTGAAAEAVLARGHLLLRPVRGFSMAPWIQDGDRVVLAPAASRDIRPGDIVQFAAPDGLRVHRVLAVEAGMDGLRFFVAGDASELPDGPVPEAAILGRVVAVTRLGRTVRLDAPAARLRARLRAWRARLGRRLRGRRSP